MADHDPVELVHKAIRSGFLGHIQWKQSAADRVRDNPEMENWTPEGIRALLREFVLAGGHLEQRREQRDEYDCPWYRAVVPVEDFPKGMFIEVTLIDDDPEEPWVEIVSAHRQR